MKKSILLLLFVVCSAHAQKKYQSLLWEISGNGLSKNSYLYGSMHVSEKVSYHLSDSFFTHLLAADFVANESDPSSWIEIYDVMNTEAEDIRQNQKFYSRFYQQPIKKEQLYPLFVANNNTLNNILFRTNETQKDYQEDTYLDMFIHQTGKKYNKKTVGLEDAKSSMISIMNISQDGMRPKEENMQAIMKLLKEKSFNQALLDYYRDKNLDMIDSIYSLIAPENYLKAMLYDRNVTMTNSIDSLAKKGSLFAAIGAAHLPGKLGVIEALRAKGYTVTPIIDAYTEKGKKIKREIDDFLVKPIFVTQTSADGMLKLPMIATAIYNQDDISTPDLSNGGIISVKRVALRNYLRKDGSTFDPRSIDSLLYENIPGEILEKKKFTESNYRGFDIRSKTTTGNAQHYRYYITPLEIIAVNMSGNGDYVRRFENEIFNNIKLRNSNSDWETITPKKGGFTISAPGYYTLYGNRESSNPSDIELTAFDDTDQSYYFLTERTLEDIYNLEDTAFELERIHTEFFMQIGAVKILSQPARGGFESLATVGNRTLCLKTVILGQKYYLLGTSGATSANTKKFFESFRFTPFEYDFPTRKLTDIYSGFEISVPEKQNEKLFWKAPRTDKKWDKNNKENIFIGKTETYNFTAASGNKVELRFLQYHRYGTEKNIDSVWAYYRKSIRNDYAESDYAFENEYENNAGQPTLENAELYEKKGFSESKWNALLHKTARKKSAIQLLNEKITFDKQRNLYQFEVTATSETSAQAIRHKGIFQNGMSYWFKTVVPKNYKNDDPFIESIFDSFKLLPTDHEVSIFESKTDLFIADVKSEADSIRYSALASVYMLDPTESDFKKLKKFILDFDFRDDEISAKTDLIEKIGTIKDPAVVPFLESLYKNPKSNPIVQFAVIRAIANQETKAGYKSILELFEYDLPLTNASEISGLFRSFMQVENSAALFPGIFQFYNIEEYRDPIIEFTIDLFNKELINLRHLGNYRKMLLANAKLELKRITAWKANQLSAGSSDYYFDTSPTKNFINYLNLLSAFKNDRSTSDLFRKATTSGIGEINLEIARLELLHNRKLTLQQRQELLQRPQTAFVAYQLFLNENAITPELQISDDDLAEVAVIHLFGIRSETSEMMLVEKREVIHNEKTVTFYFYRISPNVEDQNYGNTLGRIVGVAFVNDKNGIDPGAFRSVSTRHIIDESDIPETVDSLIDETLNYGRIRASFGRLENEPLIYNDY